LNVHRVRDVRQIEIQTAEPLVPDPTLFEVEIAVENFERYKSPGSDQIPAELVQAGGELLCSKNHRVILFGIRKKCLTSGRNLLLDQFTRRLINLTINYWGISLLSTSYKILSNNLITGLSPYIQ
jgi:hypothetical protein